MNRRLEMLERWTVIVLTALAAAFHVILAFSAGGLWRDEANTVGIVTLPTVSDVWKNLQYDSFPFGWIMLIRGFTAIFWLGERRCV